MSMMAASSSAPNSMGVGPRQRRTKRRTPVPLMQGPWRESSWVQSFSSQSPSPLGNPQDLTPAFALRKIVLLMEKEKFIDVSQLINQLNNVILKSILQDIPIQTFIDNIPDSLVAIESLYSKLFILDPENFPIDKLAIEAMVFQIVRHMAMLHSMLDFGQNPSDEERVKSITNVLRIVLFVKPDIVSVVYSRKKLMENALHGIGEHSLVKVAGSLMNLHDGLKIEFEKTTTSYKTAVQQLEQLSLSNPKPITLKSFANRSMPSANHQVLMTYTEAEIQDRLFKNKTVLNAVESNMNNQLPHLIQTLKERIECDKNALLAFGRLRHEIKGISGETKVAPVLTQYSRSLKSVLEIFKHLLDEQYPERKVKGLNFPNQEDQILQLEEVDGAPRDSQNLESSTDFHQSIADGDNPPPPTQAPPPTPLPGSPSLQTSESDKDAIARLAPLPQENQRRGRSRERTRRKKGTVKSRATSVDLSQVKISRPERESVEDNRDFQMMMKRINSVSASSPAVGRRGLEKRGISPMRNGLRSVSVSPTSYHRHLLGEDTPLSELSQMEREQAADSRRSSQSSASDIQKPVPPPRQSQSSALDTQKPVPTPRQSGRPASMSVTGSAGPQADESYSLLMKELSKREDAEKERDWISLQHREALDELQKTRDDLRLARSQVNRLQETEKKLNQEIAKLSCRPALQNNDQQGVVKSKHNIVGDLLYEYDKLYSDDRARAWMSLKLMSEQKQFEDGDNLKDKVLFSVIVLAFRTSKNSLEFIRGGVQQLLHTPVPQDRNNTRGKPLTGDVGLKEKTSAELLQFLRQLGAGYDLALMVQNVRKQLFTALYDYPKLTTSLELGNFIERCVSLAWRLGIQELPLTIAYEDATYNSEIHQRAPGSNRKSLAVKSYLWPCLLEEETGQCVYKGVVVT